mgnify:CR=1 FL=1
MYVLIRTTFGKTFTYYIVVLLIASFLLSLGFTEIFRGYFYNDQRDNLLNQAIKISDIYIQSSKGENFDESYFINEINNADKYMDYSFLLLDTDLNVITNSKDILTLEPGDTINKFFGYNDVMLGKFEWLQGDLDDIYEQTRYILCYPVKINNKVDAIVIISIPLSEFSSYINRVYIIVISFFILAIILGFFTIHWATNEFVIPVRRLSNVAKYISKGNFDKKMEVTEDMNDEIKELCSSFNSMAESLDGLEKRRREIISNISHDLRSPITSIRGFLQAMLDGTIPEKKHQHYMEIIFNETSRLNKLSNSILDLNKLDDSSNALNLSNFDINKVIDETIKLMRGKADIKKIELKHNFSQDKLMVNADLDKIRRVVINLVDNGIKFTNEGSVTIASKIENERAVISVSDTGIGLSEEEQSRVFERLYKADESRGMDKTGSGLGLAIVKEFVKAHNQNVELKSQVGKGSCFTFTLELAK